LPWKAIVDENYSMAHEYFLFIVTPSQMKLWLEILLPVADPRPFLDFYESPNLHVIADLAAIEICERENLDPLAKLHVRAMRW